MCDSKEEAVRLQQAMEKQLEETNARWDKERRTMTQHADQANKVSVWHPQETSHLITLKGYLHQFHTRVYKCQRGQLHV